MITLLTLATFAWPAGWLGVLFKIAIASLIIWGVIELVKSTGWPIPRAVVIIFTVLVGILLICWLFEIFSQLVQAKSPPRHFVVTKPPVTLYDATLALSFGDARLIKSLGISAPTPQPSCTPGGSMHYTQSITKPIPPEELNQVIKSLN